MPFGERFFVGQGAVADGGSAAVELDNLALKDAAVGKDDARKGYLAMGNGHLK